MKKYLFSQIIKEDNKTIKCNNVEQKTVLYHQADKLGLKWCTGRSYCSPFNLSTSFFNDFKTGTYVDGFVCDNRVHPYQIINFEEIEFGDNFENDDKKSEPKTSNVKMKAMFDE